MIKTVIQNTTSKLSDVEIVLNKLDGIEFISFCLEMLEKEIPVQTIWLDWQELIYQTQQQNFGGINHV